MSAYHQIFVRTAKPLEEFLRDLGSAAGAEICALEPTVNGIAYAGRTGATVIEVELSHEFEEDRGMDFSAYPVVATVRELNADVATKERAARAVFDKLRDIGGYDLLFVFDLQRLLGRT